MSVFFHACPYLGNSPQMPTCLTEVLFNKTFFSFIKTLFCQQLSNNTWACMFHLQHQQSIPNTCFSNCTSLPPFSCPSFTFHVPPHYITCPGHVIIRIVLRKSQYQRTSEQLDIFTISSSEYLGTSPSAIKS